MTVNLTCDNAAVVSMTAKFETSKVLSPKMEQTSKKIFRVQREEDNRLPVALALWRPESALLDEPSRRIESQVHELPPEVNHRSRRQPEVRVATKQDISAFQAK